MAQNDETKLEFGMSLHPDIGGFREEWKKTEKTVQEILDKSDFNIKIKGVDGLKEALDSLEKIQAIQRDTFKPMTQYQAGKLRIMEEAKARETNARVAKIEGSAVDENRKKKAQAEITEIRLERAKRNDILTTNQQTRAYRAQSGVLNGMKQFINSYFSLLGVGRLIGGIKQITSEFELQRVSLRAITQDIQFADQLFSKIKMTAVESPFSTKELVTYTKQLAAYRIENEELYDTMQMLADVSAGLGVGMDRLILAYGQVKAASVLRGTELRQFTEAGIPLVDLLAKKFSQLNNQVVTTSDVFDLISRRKVPFEMVAEIFRDMTKDGGRFYEMQKKQSESLYGVFENLTDAIQNSFDQIGKSNRGLLMGAGKFLTLLANNLQGVLDLLQPIIYGFGAYKVAVMLVGSSTRKLAASNALLAAAEASITAATAKKNREMLKSDVLMAAAIKANNHYALATIKAAKANNVFSKSFYKIEAFLIKNPLGAALTAATVVITGVQIAYDRFIKSLSSAENAHKRFAKTLTEIKEPLKDASKSFDGIIERFKEQEVLIDSQTKSWDDFSKIWPDLAKKYRDQEGREKALTSTLDEKKKLIGELINLSPEYFGNIDAEKAKVEDLRKAYANMVEEMRATERERLEADKSRIEEQILQKEAAIKTQLRYGRGLGVALDNKVLREEIKGLKVELQDVVEELNKITDAEKVAGDAALYWREKFNELVKNNGLNNEELAAIDFSKSIKETQETWKDAKEQAKNYEDAIKELSQVPVPSIDVIKQIENFKDLKSEQDKLIKGAEEYARLFGFFLEQDTDSKTKRKEKLDSLRNEISLVEDVYRQYLKLSEVQDEPRAKKTVSDMYSGLISKSKMAFSSDEVANILEQLSDQVEALGDKDFAVKIRLKAEDFRIDGIIRQIDRMMAGVKEQIDRQSVTTDFFEKIVGLTGNEELATKLTLSITGINVNEGDVRTLLARQIADAISVGGIETLVPTKFILDGDVDVDSLTNAIAKGEVSVQSLLQMIDKISNKDIQNKLRSALSQFVDYNKDMVSNLFETISKFGKFTDRENVIVEKADQAKKRIQKTLRPDDVSADDWAIYIQSAIDAIDEKAAQDLAAVRFDELRSKYSSTLKNMETSTYEALGAVKELLGTLVASGDMSVSDLNAALDLIKQIEEAQIDANPLKAFGQAVEDLNSAYKSGKPEDINKGWKTLSSSAAAASKAVQNFADSVSGLIDESVDLVESMGVAISPEVQDAIDGFNQGMKIAIGLLGLIVTGIVLADIAAKSLQATLWPLLVATIALGAGLAIFKVLNNIKTRKADKEIKRLSKSIEGTERALKELEFSEKSLLGSDWVKNQLAQVELLHNKSKDLAAQAEAEKSKGKKADEDKYQDYLDKSVEAEREAMEKHREMVEEMTGTGLADAAKNFAKNWLDAYLSFDNTMDAMKNSFKDMMKSLVVNSVFARVVQKKLEPVFEAIDKALSDDGELSVSEWNRINEMSQRIIEGLDQDLSRLGELYNLRDILGSGNDTGSLQGIAKGVAQASEESVLTLAGYANSILYYQIAIKNDISIIRAILEGRITSMKESDGSGKTLNVGQLIAIQQASIAELKSINANTLRSANSLDRIEEKLDSVISPVGVSARKVVNTKL